MKNASQPIRLAFPLLLGHAIEEAENMDYMAYVNQHIKMGDWVNEKHNDLITRDYELLDLEKY